MSEKKTIAVFLRTRRNQADALIREQYNIVSYGNDPATYIEGLDMSLIRQLDSNVEVPVKKLDVYDEFRVYDAPPFAWARLGTLQ